MNTEISLLPVPVNTPIPDKPKREKIPKKYKIIFLVFLAAYFISTLLGAALVPGRLDIESASFVLSITENGASLFCAERCFFALFLFFVGFSFLRYPVSLLFLICEGIITGIIIKLIMYQYSVFSSLVFAFLTSCLILLDIFIISFCFSYVFPQRTRFFPILYNALAYILYAVFSLLFSYLITLLF